MACRHRINAAVGHGLCASIHLTIGGALLFHGGSNYGPVADFVSHQNKQEELGNHREILLLAVTEISAQQRLAKSSATTYSFSRKMDTVAAATSRQHENL